MDSIIKDFKKKFACRVSLGEVLGQKDKPEIVIQVGVYAYKGVYIFCVYVICKCYNYNHYYINSSMYILSYFYILLYTWYIWYNMRYV